MTLGAFMLACEALRQQQGVRFHVETEAAPVPSAADVKQQNADAMQNLMGLMSGMRKR